MNNLSDLVEKICTLYGERYDDRDQSKHKSLLVFQKELMANGYNYPTCKIKKILISGNKWSTQTSRKINAEFEKQKSKGYPDSQAIENISKELGLSKAAICTNLPYLKVAYNMEHKSKNAIRCKRYRESKERKV